MNGRACSGCLPNGHETGLSAEKEGETDGGRPVVQRSPDRPDRGVTKRREWRSLAPSSVARSRWRRRVELGQGAFQKNFLVFLARLVFRAAQSEGGVAP